MKPDRLIIFITLMLIFTWMAATYQLPMWAFVTWMFLTVMYLAGVLLTSRGAMTKIKDMKFRDTHMALIFALLSTATFAGECPKLKGEYHCMISASEYSLLVIDQKEIFRPGQTEYVEYSFDYRAIPGAPDVVGFSVSGEPDDMGYTNRCKDQRLLSGSQWGDFYQEMYLDREGALIRQLNGRIVMSCPHKD